MKKTYFQTLTHTHTHTTQPFYGSVEFVRENPGEPVPEETFTHYSHRSHQSSLQTLTMTILPRGLVSDHDAVCCGGVCVVACYTHTYIIVQPLRK